MVSRIEVSLGENEWEDYPVQWSSVVVRDGRLRVRMTFQSRGDVNVDLDQEDAKRVFEALMAYSVRPPEVAVLRDLSREDMQKLEEATRQGGLEPGRVLPAGESRVAPRFDPYYRSAEAPQNDFSGTTGSIKNTEVPENTALEPSPVEMALKRLEAAFSGRLPASKPIVEAIHGLIRAEVNQIGAPGSFVARPARIRDTSKGDPRGQKMTELMPICSAERPAPSSERGGECFNWGYWHPDTVGREINEYHSDWRYDCPHCKQVHISEGPDA